MNLLRVRSDILPLNGGILIVGSLLWDEGRKPIPIHFLSHKELMPDGRTAPARLTGNFLGYPAGGRLVRGFPLRSHTSTIGAPTAAEHLSKSAHICGKSARTRIGRS